MKTISKEELVYALIDSGLCVQIYDDQEYVLMISASRRNFCCDMLADSSDDSFNFENGAEAVKWVRSEIKRKRQEFTEMNGRIEDCE